jgi:hypothetical protein
MMQAQAQAPPSGDFATMPLWTRGNAVPSSSEEGETLAFALADMIAVLDDDTTPSSRNGNTGDGRGSADRPKRNTPKNSPGEPSAQ